MTFHPTDPNIIVAGVSGGSALNTAGLWKTTDAGASWTEIDDTYTNSNGINWTLNGYTSIVTVPGTNDFFTTTSSFGPAGFNYHTDFGDNWTRIFDFEDISSNSRAAISPSNPDYVYVVTAQPENTGGDSFEGLYRSTNGGQSFALISTTPNILGASVDGSSPGGQGDYDLCITVDPLDHFTIYVGGINLWKSTDGGFSWNIVTYWNSQDNNGAPVIHADQHFIEFSPHNGNIYVGNDGGVYTSTDNGLTWNDISGNLAIAQIYKLGQSQLTKDLVLSGYQDNGTTLYDGAFATILGGDGIECIIDYTDDSYKYLSTQSGQILRLKNNYLGRIANQAGGIDPHGITEISNFLTTYALHETDPNVMFSGYQNIWRSNNIKTANTANVTWTNITNQTPGSTIRTIEHSPANTDLLYYTKFERLFRIDNAMAGSATEIDLTGNLPVSDYTPTDLEAHPTDENIVYMTIANKVYQSNDKGVSWTDITGPFTLPNISLNTIVYEIGSNDRLYLGADAGVYTRENGDSDWSDFFHGLPLNSEITDLEIYYDPLYPNQNRLRAGTFGRGLWESRLDYFVCPTNANTILYVDSSAVGGDGQSWASAFNDLQDALDAAHRCTNISEIWVAKGSYFPTIKRSITDIRSKTFCIDAESGHNFKIYGGFNGWETDRSQRDWLNNITTLNGDIGIRNNHTDNSHNVVHITRGSSTNTIIDGFHIVNGNADGGNGNGGGIYNEGSSLYATSPIIRNCTFANNNAIRGGGICNLNFSGADISPTILNCQFLNNTADYGGAIYSNTSSATLNTQIINCTFANNSANFEGGGLHHTDLSSLGNTPAVINCSFSNNTATNNGGAIYSKTTPLEVRNCILWGNDSPNGTDEIKVVGLPFLNLRNSIIDDGNIDGNVNLPSLVTGSNNLDADPIFINSGLSNLRLRPNSPAIDQGNSSFNSYSTDLDNNNRVTNGTIDLGPYETQADTDGDGIADLYDNCPSTSNPALDLDGNDDFVNIPHSTSLELDDVFTLEAWIYKRELDDERILNKGFGNISEGFAFDTGFEDDKLRFINVNGNLNGGTALSINTWYHVAVVYDLSNGTATLYLDGQEDGQISISQPLSNPNAYPLIIGKEGDSNYKGTIDEVRIWNDVARTQLELQENMYQELNGNETGLAAYYNFNNGLPNGDNTALTTIEDISGNGNTGTLFNFHKMGTTSNWVNGSLVSSADNDNDNIGNNCDNCPDTANPGLDFDASGNADNHLEVPHDAAFNLTDGDFTFEAWVYLEGSNNETILSKGNGGGGTDDVYIFQAMANGTNKLGLELSSSTSGNEWHYSNTDLPLNQWIHVAITFAKSSGNIRFFLNGVPDGVQTTTITDLYNADNNSLYIGRQGHSCDCNYFNGKMDEVRVWDVRRTISEVASQWNTELDGSESGLVAHYTFNNGLPNADNSALTTIDDSSGNGHHGTLMNFAKTGTASNWVDGALISSNDEDGDGTGDHCDQCPGFDDSQDSDSDGVPNACDCLITTVSINIGDCNNDLYSFDLMVMGNNVSATYTLAGDLSGTYNYGQTYTFTDMDDVKTIMVKDASTNCEYLKTITPPIGCTPYYDCNEDDYILDFDVISSGYIHAVNSIVSENIIESPDVVVFRAGYDITLTEFFQADEGSDFIAEIVDCNQAFESETSNEIEEGIIDEIISNEVVSEYSIMDLNIFPNPATDKLTINFTIPENQNSTIAIYNNMGALVKSVSENQWLEKGEYNQEIAINNLPIGIYIVALHTGKQTLSKKLIKLE